MKISVFFVKIVNIRVAKNTILTKVAQITNLFQIQSVSFFSFSFIFLFINGNSIDLAKAVPAVVRPSAYFSCSVIANIPTTVFTHSKYVNRLALIEWTDIENGEKNCHDASEKLDSAFHDGTYKYIIPAYNTSKGKDRKVILCKSATPKKTRIDDTSCQEKNILFGSNTNLKADKYLEKFYRTAFSASRQNPILESRQALLYDSYGEPYIDIMLAIYGSKKYDSTQ